MQIKVPSERVCERFLLIYELEGCKKAANFLTKCYRVRPMRIILNGRKVGNEMPLSTLRTGLTSPKEDGQDEQYCTSYIITLLTLMAWTGPIRQRKEPPIDTHKIFQADILVIGLADAVCSGFPKTENAKVEMSPANLRKKIVIVLLLQDKRHEPDLGTQLEEMSIAVAPLVQF